MQVKVVFFARLRREAGVEELSVELPDGADVRALAERLEKELDVDLEGCMVAINEAYSAPQTKLQPGDEVAFLPPVSGGNGEAGPGPFHLAVTEAALDLGNASAFLTRPEHGAQAYFVGTVRSPNHGEVVNFIDYEAYAPMALNVMRGAAERASEEHGPLRVWLEHRVGRLAPGEASIVIGVGSPHRRAALEACDFLIESLKVELPVWKHEHSGSAPHWVAGQAGHPTL